MLLRTLTNSFRYPACIAEYSCGTSDEDIARFRQKAEECRQQAEKSLSSFDKESWLRLADDWIKMAQEIGRRLRRE
jgi:hypothetical protein